MSIIDPQVDVRELLQADVRRAEIRAQYKRQMQHNAHKQSKPIAGFKIVFPAMLPEMRNRQLALGVPWYYNGFLLQCGLTRMVVDPGVDFMLRLADSGIGLASINSLFVSHEHLDHSNDANQLIDWLVRAQADLRIISNKGTYKSGRISRYHASPKQFVGFTRHQSFIAAPKAYLQLEKNLRLEYIKLFHDIECYGFTLHDQSSNRRISYISDTGYATSIKTMRGILATSDLQGLIDGEPVGYHQSLKRQIQNSQVLIINIDGFMYGRKSATHFTIRDLLHLITNTSTRRIYLTHLNPVGELPHDEWGRKLATYISEKTGIACFAPSSDGLIDHVL